MTIKALAIKKRMFTSFQDYDGYSFYGANRIYFALKKNLENQGKVVKGKEIRPIKSCLNYIKTLMYPMKIEYLREEYNTSLAEAQTSKKFDSFMAKQKAGDEIWQSQGGAADFRDSMYSFLGQFDRIMDEVLDRAPFAKGTVDYQHLKISILLNVLANLRKGKGLDSEPATVLLWKLPKSMGNYVKLFLKELGTSMKQEIMSNYSGTRLDDKVIGYMLSHPEGEFIDHENKD